VKQVAHSKRTKHIALCALAAATSFAVKPAIADEGGVSFWVPGFFGNLPHRIDPMAGTPG